MKRLRTISIRTKFFIVFGASIIFIGLIIFVGLSDMLKMREASRMVYEEAFLEAQRFMELKDDLNQVRLHLVHMLGEPDEKKLPIHHKAIKDATKRIDNELQAMLRDDKFDRESVPFLNQIKSLWDAFRDTRDSELLPAIFEGDMEKARSLTFGDQAKRFNGFAKLADILVEHEKEEAKMLQRAVDKRLRHSILTYLITVVVGLIVATTMITYYSRDILKRIMSLAHAAEDIGEGKDEIREVIAGQDEIGTVAKSFTRMAVKLKEKTSDLKMAKNKLEDRNEELELLNQGLKESESKYRGLIDHAIDAVISIDQDGNIVLFNEAATRMFGCRVDEAMGMNITNFMPNEYREKHSAGMKRFNETAEKNIIGNVVEVEGLTKSGRKIPLSISMWERKENNAYVFTAILRDITKRKRAEAEVERKRSELESAYKDLEKAYEEIKNAQAHLLQSEKMASIGQLAAGVAHEINNPIGFVSSNLGTMTGYVEDLSRLVKEYKGLIDLLDDVNKSDKRIGPALNEIKGTEEEIDVEFIMEDIVKVVDESKDGVERVKKIVKDLKDFSHVDQAELKYVDINRGLKSTLNIVWNELKYKAEVIKEYGDIPELECYPQQLNQVFMNILVNAAQAIEDRGEIRIKTYSDNGSVIVEISDTGSGIPEEHIKKIFDPFFTTKPIGKGTGLGLNIAYGIVKRHNGNIDIESEVGKGTKFTITLPITNKN